MPPAAAALVAVAKPSQSGVARLANVDVAVDEARQEHDVVAELQGPNGGWPPLERLEGDNAAAGDGHRAGLLALPAEYRPGSGDDEVEGFRHDRPTSRDLGIEVDHLHYS